MNPLLQGVCLLVWLVVGLRGIGKVTYWLTGSGAWSLLAIALALCVGTPVLAGLLRRRPVTGRPGRGLLHGTIAGLILMRADHE